MSDSTELAEVSSIRSGGWEAGRRVGVWRHAEYVSPGVDGSKA